MFMDLTSVEQTQESNWGNLENNKCWIYWEHRNYTVYHVIYVYTGIL